MATLVLKWDRSQVDALRKAGLMPALMRTLRKSGRDTIRAMRAESSRWIRARKRLRAGAVNKGLTLRSRGGRRPEDLEWRIDLSNKPMPLSAYPHRQVKRGVSVAVNRAKRKIIKSAFVATMKSGHRGIFVREGNKRLPIRELLSTRIADVIQDTGAIPSVFRRGGEVFAASFDRLLPLEVAKIQAARGATSSTK